MKLITNKEYLANSGKLHQQYYEQLVTPELLNYVVERIGSEKILNSADPNFNDIPLNKWEIGFGKEWTTNQLKKVGAFYSLSSVVCIAKAAARKYKNQHEQV